VGTMIADRLGGIYVTAGFVRLRRPEGSQDSGGVYILNVSAATDDGKTREFDVTTIISGADELAPHIEARIKAREKAAQPESPAGAL